MVSYVGTTGAAETAIEPIVAYLRVSANGLDNDGSGRAMEGLM